MSDAIIVTRMADGGIQVEVTCRRGDESHVARAVHQMSQDCIDDTYGTYDKLRDHETRFARGRARTERVGEVRFQKEITPHKEFEG